MHILTVGQYLDLRGCATLSPFVAAVGDHIRPYLSYLSGLTDLLGWTSLYVPSWVCEFYATLWIDP